MFSCKGHVSSIPFATLGAQETHQFREGRGGVLGVFGVGPRRHVPPLHHLASMTSHRAGDTRLVRNTQHCIENARHAYAWQRCVLALSPVPHSDYGTTSHVSTAVTAGVLCYILAAFGARQSRNCGVVYILLEATHGLARTQPTIPPPNRLSSTLQPVLAARSRVCSSCRVARAIILSCVPPLPNLASQPVCLHTTPTPPPTVVLQQHHRPPHQLERCGAHAVPLGGAGRQRLRDRHRPCRRHACNGR